MNIWNLGKLACRNTVVKAIAMVTLKSVDKYMARQNVHRCRMNILKVVVSQSETHIVDWGKTSWRRGRGRGLGGGARDEGGGGRVEAGGITFSPWTYEGAFIYLRTWQSQFWRSVIICRNCCTISSLQAETSMVSSMKVDSTRKVKNTLHFWAAMSENW